MIDFMKKIETELKDGDMEEVDVSKRKFKWHKASNIEPKTDEYNYSSIKNDIATIGQREPVLIYNEMIVDGRHRQKMCIELNIPMKILKLRNKYTLSELEEYVRSKHMSRDKSKTQKEIQAYDYKRSTANVEWIDACRRYGVKERSVKRIVSLFNLMRKNGYEQDFYQIKDALFQNFTLLPVTYEWMQKPTTTFFGALKQFKEHLEYESTIEEEGFIDPTEVNTATGESLVKIPNALLQTSVSNEDRIRRLENLLTKYIEKYGEI